MYSQSIILFLILFSLNDFARCQHMSSLNYRRQMNMMRSMAQKAYEHGIRINEEAQCSKPHPELIYMNDSKKIYLPRATVLHRCSDLHGCCPHATHSCEPSRVEKVTLYFFVIGIQSQNMIRRNQNIEQLNFINHTECACKPIDPMWGSEQIRQQENVQNNNNATTSITQIRTIRDPGYPDFVSSSPPSYVIHGRNNNNFQSRQEEINRDMYQESEDVLKYWAKLMGYNADKVHYFSKHNKRANKRSNVPKKITIPTVLSPPPSSTQILRKSSSGSITTVPSTSYVRFATPEVSYSYSTVHNNNHNNNNNNNQPSSSLSSYYSTNLINDQSNDDKYLIYGTNAESNYNRNSLDTKPMTTITTTTTMGKNNKDNYINNNNNNNDRNQLENNDYTSIMTNTGYNHDVAVGANAGVFISNFHHHHHHQQQPLITEPFA